MRTGDIWTRIPAVATPPPVEQTFDKIVLSQTPKVASDFGMAIAMAQLYFGTSGTVDGFYSNKTTFLADHPGLTLYDFAGGGPGCTPLVPTFPYSPVAGITITITTDDAANSGLYSDACDSYPWPDLDVSNIFAANPGPIITVVFDPPITAAGFNFETRIGAPNAAWQVDYYDGVTLLHSETGATAPPKLTSFAGFSTAS